SRTQRLRPRGGPARTRAQGDPDDEGRRPRRRQRRPRPPPGLSSVFWTEVWARVRRRQPHLRPRARCGTRAICRRQSRRPHRANRRRPPPGSPRWSGPRGRDVLDLEELLDADLSALTAETRHLHTSEGCAGVRDQARAESDYARFEPVGQAERTLEVLAEQVAGQPELGLIGQSDRLVVGVEGDDRCDGAEDLGGADLAVGGHIGDDGGIEEEALALDPLAAGEDL